MTTETLKPCPFCGGRAALSTIKKRIGTACKHTVIRQHAVCKVCGAQTRVFKALDRAPRAWNRRQTDADRIEELTAEVAAYGRSLELKQALIEELIRAQVFQEIREAAGRDDVVDAYNALVAECRLKQALEPTTAFLVMFNRIVGDQP